MIGVTKKLANENAKRRRLLANAILNKAAPQNLPTRSSAGCHATRSRDSSAGLPLEERAVGVPALALALSSQCQSFSVLKDRNALGR